MAIHTFTRAIIFIFPNTAYFFDHREHHGHSNVILNLVIWTFFVLKIHWQWKLLILGFPCEKSTQTMRQKMSNRKNERFFLNFKEKAEQGWSTRTMSISAVNPKWSSTDKFPLTHFHRENLHKIFCLIEKQDARLFMSNFGLAVHAFKPLE